MQQRNEEKTYVNYKGVPGEIELSDDKNTTAWQRLQYGMFIHWGLYSKAAGEWQGKPVTKGYSEQIQMWANIPESDYIKVADQFTAERFDPKAICTLAKDAGMKYIVITSKHHDGFSMFDTKTTDYNIVERTPFAQDPLKLLSDECHRQGLKFGVYFSLVDWHQGHKFEGNNNNTIPESMEPVIEGQLRELMTNYGPIAEVWFDMSSPTMEQSNKFAGIIHELQPEAAVNGRIWNNRSDFRTLGDNQVPTVTLDGAWQTPASIYHKTWGYRNWQVRDDFDGKVRDLVEGLTCVHARGGNYLLNIGPRGDGSIVEFEADVLSAMGEWLDRHPGAILGSSATQFAEQPWGEVTVNDKQLFLHITNWPESGQINLPGLATDVLRVVEDGAPGELDWQIDGNNLVITLPATPTDEILPVIRVEMSGNLRVIPEKTVAVNTDDKWTINSKDMYAGCSYADDGNYNSLVQTTIRQTAFISNRKEGSVMLDIQGEANPGTNYSVQLGQNKQIVTGEQLMNAALGPFTVHADEIIPLHITLAEPAYVSQELGLQLDSITIRFGEDSQDNS